MSGAGPLSLLLTLADRRVRVALEAAAEVSPCPALALVPGMPPWLAGLAVIKGEAVPTVDLGLVLGGAPLRGEQRRARVVKTRAAGFVVAFLVQDVERGDGASADALDLASLARRLLDQSLDPAAAA